MKSIKDWTDYYKEHHVYTCPSNYDFNWKDWQDKNIAENTYNSFNWNNTNKIYGIAGVKGIKVIMISFNVMPNNETIDKVAHKTLELLNLRRYPWVITTPTALLFLVESKSSLNTNDYVEGVSLICQGPFVLPTDTKNDAYKPKYYFNGLPTISPKHKTPEEIENCIQELRKYIKNI